MVALAVIERRQELALGEVAGAAENDEIERIDWNNLARHTLFSNCSATMPLHNLIDLKTLVHLCRTAQSLLVQPAALPPEHLASPAIPSQHD